MVFPWPIDLGMLTSLPPLPGCHLQEGAQVTGGRVTVCVIKACEVPGVYGSSGAFSAVCGQAIWWISSHCFYKRSPFNVLWESYALSTTTCPFLQSWSACFNTLDGVKEK